MQSRVRWVLVLSGVSLGIAALMIPAGLKPPEFVGRFRYKQANRVIVANAKAAPLEVVTYVVEAKFPLVAAAALDANPDMSGIFRKTWEPEVLLTSSNASSRIQTIAVIPGHPADAFGPGVSRPNVSTVQVVASGTWSAQILLHLQSSNRRLAGKIHVVDPSDLAYTHWDVDAIRRHGLKLN